MNGSFRDVPVFAFAIRRVHTEAAAFVVMGNEIPKKDEFTSYRDTSFRINEDADGDLSVDAGIRNPHLTFERHRLWFRCVFIDRSNSGKDVHYLVLGAIDACDGCQSR